VNATPFGVPKKVAVRVGRLTARAGELVEAKQAAFRRFYDDPTPENRTAAFRSVNDWLEAAHAVDDAIADWDRSNVQKFKKKA